MPDPTDPLSPDAVSRAQQGDDAARERLLTALQRVLRRFFERRAGARSEVDDLVQNTLVRVHQGLGELKDPARLQPFAMKAALYELQDFYRGRYASREQLYDPERPPEQVTEPVGGEGIDAERALGELSDKARRVVELRAYGYRYEEIADIMGSTEAAIKMQVKRAFEKMRGALGALAAFWIGAAAWLAAGARGASP